MTMMVEVKIGSTQVDDYDDHADDGDDDCADEDCHDQDKKGF